MSNKKFYQNQVIKKGDRSRLDHWFLYGLATQVDQIADTQADVAVRFRSFDIAIRGNAVVTQSDVQFFQLVTGSDGPAEVGTGGGFTSGCRQRP